MVPIVFKLGTPTISSKTAREVFEIWSVELPSIPYWTLENHFRGFGAWKVLRFPRLDVSRREYQTFSLSLASTAEIKTFVRQHRGIEGNKLSGNWMDRPFRFEMPSIELASRLFVRFDTLADASARCPESGPSGTYLPSPVQSLENNFRGLGARQVSTFTQTPSPYFSTKVTKFFSIEPAPPPSPLSLELTPPFLNIAIPPVSTISELGPLCHGSSLSVPHRGFTKLFSRIITVYSWSVALFPEEVF